MAVRSAQRVGRQGRLDGLVLDGGGEQGEGPLIARPLGKITQPAPDLVLYRRRDWHALGGDDVLHPFLGPGAVVGRVDLRQRLEGQLALVAAQDIELAADKQRRCAGAGALVEIEDLSFRIAQPLHGQGVEQD